MKTFGGILCLLVAFFNSSFALFGKRLPVVRRNLMHCLLRAGSSSVPTPFNGLAVDYDGETPPEKALILMDVFCPYHGGYLANRAREIPGVAVVYLLSEYLFGYLQRTSNLEEEQASIEAMRLPGSPAEIEEWKKALGDDDSLKLVAVYCESDAGLADAERLRDWLQVECLDDPVIHEARRNKYLMQEAVRNNAGGLAVAKQKLCETADEARAFAGELFAKQQRRVVVKPIRGVASESVYLCQNLQEVDEAWNKIISTSVYGSGTQHANVLVQEFLNGTEYAVDVVSRNGDHKIAAIWRYDKRPANGAAFCYFKTELVDAEMDESVVEICTYIKSALTALGVKWGLSHNEVIVPTDNSRGPMLIEVNCRQHNMDFGPLTMACIGYNALDMTLVALLGDEGDWAHYPDMPFLRAYGCMVHLVNYASGCLKQNFYLQEMSDLPSVFEYEVYEPFRTPGERIEPTIDIRSDAGWAQLINEDPDELQHDVEQIVEWMPRMFETAECD